MHLLLWVIPRVVRIQVSVILHFWLCNVDISVITRYIHACVERINICVLTLIIPMGHIQIYFTTMINTRTMCYICILITSLCVWYVIRLCYWLCTPRESACMVPGCLRVITSFYLWNVCWHVVLGWRLEMGYTTWWFCMLVLISWWCISCHHHHHHHHRHHHHCHHYPCHHHLSMLGIDLETKCRQCCVKVVGTLVPNVEDQHRDNVQATLCEHCVNISAQCCGLMLRQC